MKNSIKEPCYILVGCLCFFTSLSFFSSTYEGFKQFDFLADVKKESRGDSAIVDAHLAEYSVDKKLKKKLAIHETDTHLEYFFTCLDSLKKTKKKIRIAHFGDSMLEGDLITSTLRENFQKEFGGSGVGFLVPSPYNASFRQTITHDFSNNIETINLKDKSPEFDIGISGYTSITNGNSWITLKSKSNNEILKVYYGKGKSEGNLALEVNSLKANAVSSSALNEYAQTIDSTGVLVNFSSSSSVPIYGLSLESDSGIMVDNFSFRGSSGTLFKDQNKELLKQFQHYLNYDLIILQYGINVASAKTTDYSWYERTMLANIKFLKEAFPNTSFLIIGCSDRAVKSKGVYATSKGIEPLIETQKRLAQQTGSGFLNFYEAMGGNGSMIKWVNGDTCFANKDFTHFNHKGAEKAGNIIYASIMKQYQNWKKEHETIY